MKHKDIIMGQNKQPICNWLTLCSAFVNVFPFIFIFQSFAFTFADINNNHMKYSRIKFCFAFIIVLFASPFCFSQQNATAPAAESVEYKAENPGWLVKLEEAYAVSKKTNKPIMANFTGTDWCIWCKRLTAAVFSKDDFKKWAEKNVVLLEIDFPNHKQLPAEIRNQNAGLQQAFQVRGYPSVWLFDLELDKATNKFNIVPLGQTGYKATVAEFTGEIDGFLTKRKIQEAKAAETRPINIEIFSRTLTLW